ncbi:hypothetical protein BJ878DRAFT_492963 [Calycina marina]|uniref:Uncharacterized protein n=1 Tax=Calycina marina TaxID=1763456 RepID=A0A9P8CHJ0_9HELO|nr:hypothetical protein BJ878DRAFT_492963 [Calycina marina]
MDSVQEALAALCASIPGWNARLDHLNGQIAERQIELARFSDDRPPTARSLRNKGSTESLRPKDGNGAPVDDDTPNIKSVPRGSKAKDTTPSKANSNPRASHHAIACQSSKPTSPAQPRSTPAPLRKQKTASLTSGESAVPKYRSRSLIIVYYDSAVQSAFEELVKFVNGSRSAMRKGKMAAKMAEMRRTAELEVEGDGAGSASASALIPNKNPYASYRKMADEKHVALQAGGWPRDGADAGSPVPGLSKPRFTTAMPAGRAGGKVEESGSTFNLGMLRGYGRATDGLPSIFDGLDKDLQWCQSRCEFAAHQFLREGECSTEIESIRERLLGVKEKGEKELKRLTIVQETKREAPPDEGIYRQSKPIMMRRDFLPTGLEVDDDEGRGYTADNGIQAVETNRSSRA